MSSLTYDRVEKGCIIFPINGKFIYFFLNHKKLLREISNKVEEAEEWNQQTNKQSNKQDKQKKEEDQGWNFHELRNCFDRKLCEPVSWDLLTVKILKILSNFFFRLH